VNKVDRTDELRVNKAGIAEVDVVSLFFVNGSLSMLSVGNKYSSLKIKSSSIKHFILRGVRVSLSVVNFVLY
jgi:hypothetical protein